MSRKGKKPIELPKGVEVKVDSDSVEVKGPKGTLKSRLVSGISVALEGETLTVQFQEGNDNPAGKFLGLMRALIDNMVTGTSKGFEKKLEMIGVGYRASVQGHELDLQVGFSHPTRLPIPEGIQVSVEKNTIITVAGIDKQQVGEFAAVVRSKRPPEPYQGKGIRYSGEFVRRKAGKTGK
jgi:large subunit ribosomal protein L6